MELVEDDDAVEVAAAAASAWLGSSRRRHLLQFLLHASKRLDLRPIVKYAALAFFVGRLLLALPRKMGFCGERSGRSVSSCLLEPLRDSNLELFALVAVWIASKVFVVMPQEPVFMEVVEYNIGSSNIAFIYLEELLIHFRLQAGVLT